MSTTTIILETLSFLLLVSVVIGVHEFGHYLAAKFFKVKIKAVGLGFGKPLYSWNSKSGTSFNLCPLFIGGYVNLLDGRNDKVAPEDKDKDYNEKSALAKFIILIAGVVMNFILAAICYSIIFFEGVETGIPSIEKISPSSVFSNKGISQDDVITQINKTQVLDWSMFAMGAAANFGDTEPVKVVFRTKEGSKKNIYIDLSEIHLRVKDLDVFNRLGIKPNWEKGYLIQYSFFDSLLQGAKITYTLIRLNVKIITNVITGYISPLALAGPLSMIKQAHLFFLEGFIKTLQYTALISVAVGLANLIPIPGLDGGQMLILLFEKLRRKRLSNEWQLLLQRFGYIVVFMLFMQLLANDFHRMSLGIG